MHLSQNVIDFIKRELPHPYNSLDKYQQYFIHKLQSHSALCTTVIAAIKKIVQPLIKQNKNRFYCRIDESNSLKSPVSIIEKILRSRNGPVVRHELDKFTKTMKDLARFRIVGNFLDDVYEIERAIKQDVDINSHFEWECEDTIKQHRRTKGERSINLQLKRKKEPNLFIEIQLMTQLQEAWDKKDHYLIYKKRRNSAKGDDDNFPTYLDAKIASLAELLYVADEYFNQLRRDEEAINETI